MRKLFPYPSFSYSIVLGCILLFANCKKGHDTPAPVFRSVFDSVAKMNGRWAVSGSIGFPIQIVPVDSAHSHYIWISSKQFSDTIAITATADSGAAIKITAGKLYYPYGDSIDIEGTLPFQGHDPSSHVLMYGTIKDPNSVRSGENRFLYYYYVENKFLLTSSRWVDTANTISAHIDIANKF